MSENPSNNLFIGILLGVGAAAVGTALYGNYRTEKLADVAHDRLDDADDTLDAHQKQIDFLMDWYGELNGFDTPPSGDKIPDDDDKDIETDAKASKIVKSQEGNTITLRPKKAS